MKGLTKDDVDFDATWNILATAFHEIHSKNASQLSFEELFRNAYKLVLKKKADDLYDKVVKLEQTWLCDEVRVQIVSLVTPTIQLGLSGEATDAQSNERRLAGERFMKALNDSFSDHQLCMGMITDVLMYMVSFTKTSTVSNLTHNVRTVCSVKMEDDPRSTLEQWLCSAAKSS